MVLGPVKSRVCRIASHCSCARSPPSPATSQFQRAGLLTLMPLDALPSLSLAYGLAFEALYTATGAAEIDGHFIAALHDADAALADRLLAARANPDQLGTKEH